MHNLSRYTRIFFFFLLIKTINFFVPAFRAPSNPFNFSHCDSEKHRENITTISWNGLFLKSIRESKKDLQI